MASGQVQNLKKGFYRLYNKETLPDSSRASPRETISTEN
jgi:hypothetical protein